MKRKMTVHRSTAFLLAQQLFLALSTGATTTQYVVPTVRLSLNDKSSPTSLLHSFRGGALLEDDESDEYDVEEYENEDDELFELEGDVDEDDFAEKNRVDRFIDAWKKTPPLTKAYLRASAAATIVGYLMTGNQFPSFFMLKWQLVLKKMQLWRPFTAFLNLGPFGLGYALTVNFVWEYMTMLERLHHNRPYDFWMMILFGCFSMLVGYSALGLNTDFLGHNLSTFLVYVWARSFEGIEVKVFEVLHLKAEILPWFLVGQTFLLEGVAPVQDVLGIVFGHVYHHFMTAGIVRAPKFVADWYKGDSQFATAIRDRYKTIGSDFELQQ